MNEQDLRKLIKEEIEKLFFIKPELAFKIYDILKRKFPEIASELPIASAFFHMLNDELKKMDK